MTSKAWVFEVGLDQTQAGLNGANICFLPSAKNDDDYHQVYCGHHHHHHYSDHDHHRKYIGKVGAVRKPPWN